jgi:hypothetical protein
MKTSAGGFVAYIVDKKVAYVDTAFDAIIYLLGKKAHGYDE